MNKYQAVQGCNLTLATPSKWLHSIVRCSKWSEFPIVVLPNGIDLSVFHRRETSFRKRYKINEKKKLVLGVASGWDEKKGIDSFLELANVLDDKYQIVLVGTDNRVDHILPNNIISIHRTSNHEELAEIYSAADVFFNPTREDTFPTVNMEAIACGVPVLTFDVCGSPEEIHSKNGIVLSNRDINTVAAGIENICFTMTNYAEISNTASVFDYHVRLDKYIELYKTIGERGKQ